jgi:hypothetical protein
MPWPWKIRFIRTSEDTSVLAPEKIEERKYRKLQKSEDTDSRLSSRWGALIGVVTELIFCCGLVTGGGSQANGCAAVAVWIVELAHWLHTDK